MRFSYAGALCALMIAAGLAAAEGVAGTWDCVTSTPEGDMKWVLTIKEEGGKLTGMASGSRGNLPLLDPKLEGDVLTFKTTLDEVTYQVKVKVSGNKLSGTWSGGAESGPLTGVRRDS